MKVHQLLADALAAHGVRTLFGLLGDANMRYVANYVDAGHGRFLGAVHESGSVSMADGFHRFSGEYGVASVTRGPGFTNCATALTEAVRYRSSVLLLVGDAGSQRTHPQAMDTAAFAAACGAGYEAIHTPDAVTGQLATAVRRMVAERRPVVLSISDDVMAQETTDAVGSVATPAPPPRAAYDPEALDRALGLVVGANRPLILAGRGAVLAGAREELVALSRRLGAPLATSLLAKDLFRGEPDDVGLCGSVGSDVGLSVIAEADTVIAFGASLNRHTTLGGELLRGKRIVHCDADPTRIGADTPVHEAVVGDAAAVAAAMNARLAEAEVRADPWAARFRPALASASPREEFRDRGDARHIDVRTAMIALDELLPAGRAVVSDVGRFTTAAWRYLHVGDPTRFTQTGTFGSLGLGLGTAIGAAVAARHDPVVAVLGDGGFMMHLGELSSAVRHRVPLLVVVLNDGSYGAEFHALKSLGMDPAHSLLDWPDLAPVADALGARGLTVRSVRDLHRLGELSGDPAGPIVVDVKLDPYVNIRD